MNLDRYFDDIPCSLGKREEPVFQKMVRCSQEKPDFALEMSQFGRIFSGAKQVLLKLFFYFRTESRGRCYISLRFTDGTVDELVKAHIENRVDLLCKHGHELVTTGGVWATPGLSKATCFSCGEQKLGSVFYCCLQGCVFYICTYCMVFSKQHSAGLKRGFLGRVPEGSLGRVP